MEEYNKSFFYRRKNLIWRAPIICDILINTFNLKKASIVDVGCAIGEYVQEFNNRDIKAIGIEGSKCAEEYFLSDKIMIHDIRKKIDSPFIFDLCMCLEVAEHIEKEYEGTLLENLTNLSDLVLFSAAQPDQGGIGHVNCQTKEYWKRRFATYGFIRNFTEEAILKTLLEPYRKKKGLNGYYYNLMVFRREK